jgi:hypothetical protein
MKSSFLRSLVLVAFVPVAVAACGGAVDSSLVDPRGEASPVQPGPGGGGGGGGGQCTAFPSCDSGDVSLGGAQACRRGAARCYTRSLCGVTIRCESPAPEPCADTDVCDPGDREISGACPPDASCYARTRCGGTVWCVRAPIDCMGMPSCDPGHVEVRGPTECWQDDAVCYSRSMCGVTIWCTGASAPDGGGADGGWGEGGWDGGGGDAGWDADADAGTPGDGGN